MSVLKDAAEQNGAGLYGFSASLQRPNARTYKSEFQTPEGELIRLDWKLRKRDGERFLDSVQVATVTDLKSSEAGYAMGLSWSVVQTACFGLSQSARDELNGWIQGRLEGITNQRDERRFVKRIGAFELLLELTPRNAGRSRVGVTMSRADSPEDAGGSWTSYCVHEAT